MHEMSPSETVRTALQVSPGRLRKQHELVVEFGVRSLRVRDLDGLLSEACEVVAQGMMTPFAKILRPLPEGTDFLLAYGVGWDESDIGTATVGADEASPAGYAYAADRPVLSNHLGQEHRFRTPELLRKYAIERAINVPIRGASAPYGVLEADSSEGDDFIETDVVFMEGIANIISMAVDRIAIDEDARRHNPYSESILNASPDCVKIMSAAGEIEFFNVTGLCQMEFDHLDQVYGLQWAQLWPEESQGVITDALRRVSAGESVRFESYCPTAKGDPRWWDVTAAPIVGPNNQIEKVIAVSRDITERHKHEVQLASLIEMQNNKLSASDLHLEEIHHRVKNSLHLVNTLLLLQANLAVEDAVKSQLKTAAARVLTIASVHERLYQGAGSRTVDTAEYLEALLCDLGKAFGETQIALDVDAIQLSHERMAPLGLIVSELITNSLKYGKGRITVTVRDAKDHALITVSDEGDGFPETYPKPAGTGLGMRLVKSYSGFGKNAVSVDRSAQKSTIHVRFKLS
ncbi:PAS domain-containing protein [Pseudomonas sp. CFBP 8770]|uniref:sensor histidine kinase n=1 Tax=unclassified Pseudomonas TaxID=196821 RepID=UPI00178319C9|nr:MULTISPECIES: histidine kinase dimerization/phosphoacceptor domain -containing protein [unclassified Pseudomonas]MBD8475359.1 PAS domain-containing protein [Pseudomonas sp. CFBP 8773]MBD8645378.1 PAS domain-containing protein [Pseudomonas sp. CFBP 8770]